MLCEYKHIFGKEGEGVHSFRLFNIAIVDLVGTLVAAWAAAVYFKVHFLYTAVGFLVLGIVAHRIFCVNTTINKFIFGTV